MKNLNFFGSKGGVGTTTVAAAVALGLSRDGLPVSLGRYDTVLDDDLSAVCGLGNSGQPGQEIAPSVYLHNPLDEYADRPLVRTFVTDYGTDLSKVPYLPTTENYNVLVVRNEYLGLRRAIHSEGRKEQDGSTRLRFDGFVLVEEEGRALGLREVRDVLGLPHIATIPVKPTIARAVDAGVFVYRVPADVERAAKQIVAAARASESASV